ncbi:MAG: GNAT family N-acetyltransferase [Actinomycetota bacterium]
MEHALTHGALPDGFRFRPPTPTDLEEVTALYRAGELHDEGESSMSTEDVRGEWERPGFNVGVDATAVIDSSGAIVAEGELFRERLEATVHPSSRGLGIGSALLSWLEERALAQRPDGPLRVGQGVPDRATGTVALFRSRGYEAERVAWTFRLPSEVEIDDRPLPDGVRIRPFRPETETRAVHRVIDDAFTEWEERGSEPFDLWRATSIDRADFDPSLLLVAVEGPDEDIVGAAFGLVTPEEGWVHDLAVRADRRGRGIAQSLLREAFGALRSRGASQVGLSTDSRTGAKDLYLKVGMVVHNSYAYWSKRLR